MKSQLMKTLGDGFCFLMLCLPMILSAQEFDTHWVPMNAGARSTSLGHSKVMDNGSSSLFHNPAALGNYEDLTISVFASMSTLTQSSGHLESIASDGEVQTTPLKAPLNGVVIYPYPDLDYDFVNLSYGAGYSRYFQWASEHSWSFRNDGSDFSRELNSSPGVDVIYMGAGARLWDRISLGMTLNLIPSGDYFSKDVLYVDGEYVDGFAKTYTTSSTIFFNSGMLITITSQIDIGLTIKTPFEWSATEYWTSENTIPREHTLYKSPQAIGYGISYTKESIRAQYEHNIYSYSEMELDGSPIDVDDGQGNHIGLEYTRNTSKFRVGYYAEDLPASNMDERTPIPITGFTVGYGHPFGNLTLDLAFDHYSWSGDAFIQPLLELRSNRDDKVSGNTIILELNYSFADGIPSF